jgi:uncharacterized integral membrane protein (TIGR00698 family)
MNISWHSSSNYGNNQTNNGREKIITFILEHTKRLFNGVLICVIVAFAANFLSLSYGVPTMLFALLLGMALNFLMENPSCEPGICFASTTLLRVGIALLGIRITLEDIVSLGIVPVAVVVSAVIATIVFGVLAAKVLQLKGRFGLLAGGSVAICGASAALAISSVMPNDDYNRRMTILTVISVTTLSTVAMIAYPLVARSLNLDEQQTSLFIGGTIHDVAQVVGAGYSVSSDVGELSTFIKLLRVTLLIPIVFFIATFIYQPKAHGRGSRSKLKDFIPYFLLGFIFFLTINSLGIVPIGVKQGLSSLSSILLVIAISGLGIKTSLKEVAAVGWKPFGLIVINTLFLAGFIIVAIYWFN